MNTPETPKISVIVPVYNAAEWLPDLFRSLEAQTFRDFEVILVNDGSTDTSLRMCNEEAAKDVRFRVADKTNGGLSSARNFGLERAKGRWIYFIDADDMAQPTALSRLMETAVATGAEIVIGGFVEGRTMPAAPESCSGRVRIMRSEEAIHTVLYQCPPINSACGTLYRRNLFADGGPRFRKGTWYEDLDIFYKLFERAGSIAYLPEELYFYRRNPKSFIHTFSTGRMDAVDVTDRIVARYRGTPLENAALSRSFSANFNVLVLLLRTGHDAPEMLQRVWSNIRAGRRNALLDPKVRLKNKLGALLSYAGLRPLRLLSRILPG